MIEVKFNPKKLEVSIEGHANYAEEGKDIVCAAVSILFYTLAASLEDSNMVTIEKEIDKGSSKIKCTPKPKTRASVELIYWTILNGLQLMADGYPDYVKLTVG